MATRFYPDPTNAPSVSPTFGGGVSFWDGGTTNMRRRKLNITRGNNASTTFTDYSETDTTKDLKYGVLQFVSEPLNAITFTGDSCFAIFRCKESNAAANYKTMILLAYCDADGSNVTYIDDDISEAEADDTTLTALSVEETMGSATSLPQGKRLIVEIGYSAGNTKSTEYFFDINVTDNNATTDHTVGLGETAAYNSWVEFFETITEATASVERTPGSGSATIGGIQPVQGHGIFVPTEVDV